MYIGRYDINQNKIHGGRQLTMIIIAVRRTDHLDCVHACDVREKKYNLYIILYYLYIMLYI